MKPFMSLLIVIWLTAGCTGMPVQPSDSSPADHAANGKLNQWVDAELIAYLKTQLGSHPKFKGQPFLIVGMQRDEITPDIDELTAEIRDRAADALIAVPGINLVWRPAVKPWRHQQQLAQVQCDQYRHVVYYIGIDARLTPVDRQLAISVRALNVKAGKWESGFGLTWRGTPSTQQIKALQRTHTDEFLRGLRPLPFSGQQPDLLASYLAHQLSCLLQQSQSDEIRIFVDKHQLPAHAFFNTVLNLTDNYLASFNEVRVVDDIKHATVSVRIEGHRIHQGLYQVWAAAVDCRSSDFLPGADARAYVSLKTAAPRPQPAVSVVPQPTPPVPQSTPPVDLPRQPAPLLTHLEIITPMYTADCKNDWPWSAGSRVIENGRHLAAGACVAITVDLGQPARLFLISQDTQGRLTRLIPTFCPDMQQVNPPCRAGDQVRFPPSAGPGAATLMVDYQRGAEYIYAVAIADPSLADQFDQALSHVKGLCEAGSDFLAGFADVSRDQRVRTWQHYLADLSQRGGDRCEWRMSSFFH